jgi:hypothetical protein
MEKWYVVDDGGVYNVFPESDLEQYGIERDQIVKVTTNMDMAFNYAEKLNREEEERSPYFSPSQGYYNESKNRGMKVTLTESKLNSIIAESIKRVLSEGFFDSFPSMYEKKKEEDDKPKEQEGDKASAKRRERVISRLKSDGVDVAQYAYRLWPDKDEDSARSYFYKCLDGKTNDTGDVYRFTSDEINRLYSMLANDEL